MTNSKRNYFIVFHRNRKYKKESLFNVNFFYLKEKKRKASTFSYVNKPFLKGTVIFGLDFKNKMRPLKFDKIQKDGSIKPVEPRLFKQLLLAEENMFIGFSNQTPSEDMAPIMEMIENLQFDKLKIKKMVFCSSCLYEEKFTLLDNNNQINSFKKQVVCPECAMKIILRGIKSIGLVSGERVNPKLKNFFNHLLLKFKSVEKVLNTLKPDFNPVANKDATIYDVEKPTTVSKKYLNRKIDGLDIPLEFINILKDLQIFTLLPIQAISIEKGLLSDHKNQLIMAPTSGGKTLVGEFAGISRAIKEKKKMLYLVPIVALANIREEEFRKKYKSLKLKVIKKVGESLLDKKEKDKKETLKKLLNADIIVATYEAIDHVLRSGKSALLGELGTIIIDEIQVLIDVERGYLLDGLIARLKSLFEDSQYLYLSATIGEPKTLAKKLNCVLIQYNNRPVPIERHLILCVNDNIKHRNISKLIKGAYYKKSKYGFKGQSIVFTNTRKKCESLTSYLSNRGLKLRAYHGGLTSEERRIIEKEFQLQKIAGVVTTAALAAGVDLPAIQVIFESLAMGIKWLTVAEFEQMLGRAGRLKKHELGFAYLLVEPEKIYSPKMKMTEENIAIKLLNGKIKDFELIPDNDRSNTELLAFISMFDHEVGQEEILKYYNFLINNEYDLNISLKKLVSVKLIRESGNFSFKITPLGQAIAKSFLTIDQSFEIIDLLKKKTKTMMDITLNIKPLRNLYISKKIVSDLSRNVNMKYFSNNFFSASVLSLMDAEYVKKRKKFSQSFIEMVVKWNRDIFNCDCKDNPYCDCGKLNVERIILLLRTENAFSIEQICSYLEHEYNILAFKGDIIDWLENLIYSFESIKNFTEGIPNLDKNYKEEISQIPDIIKNIRNLKK